MSTPQEHVDNMTKSVQGKIDERQKMLSIIAPTVQTYYNRRKAQLAERQKDLVDVNFADNPDWDTFMIGLGMLFQAEREGNRQAEQENKGLLAFVYRVTFKFSTSVGQAERDRLQVVFGLKGVTGTTSVALLKKLNALQKRPLCVAESIMLGEVPFKRDEILARFVKKVIESNYVYIDDGQKKAIDYPYMRNFIKANWDDLLPLSTVTALSQYFTIQKGYSLSDEQEAKNKAQRKQDRITKAVESALVKGGGKAAIDNTNLSAENKSVACAKLDERMANMGYFPISASTRLYQVLRYITNKARDQSTLEKAIQELAGLKGELESELTAIVQRQTGKELASAYRQAQEQGLVSEDGKVAIPVAAD